MANWKKITTTACVAALLVSSLAACGGKNKKKIDMSDPLINVMTVAYQVESAAADSPVVEALEEYLGTKLDINWIPSAGYGEKVTATMGSGDYPHVMLLQDRSSSVIQNSRAGTFWEVGPKLQNYPNLKQSNPVILNNISVDGKVYGVYRSRTLGRNGMTIREDWLENVGLEYPQSMDEFYNVLKAFKEKDPDKNGQADTFGMIVTTAPSTLDNLFVWFGAPNKWGEKDGKLVPAHLTEEYFEALKFMKKLYDEQLINQDFATYDGGKWNDQFLTSKAGVIIDVADRSRRIAETMATEVPEAKVGVYGYVKKTADAEPKTLPTSGHAGYYVFPKQAVATEEELDFVLKVMDKANDQPALNLMNYGIEGTHYTIVDGNVEIKNEEGLTKQYADLNQFATGIIATELVKKYSTDVAARVEEVYKDNENYVVPNPAEPFVSDTYSKKGAQLDDIIATANTKFIMGQLDEAQYKAELEKWKSNGGNDYIDEINAEYQKTK